MDINVYLFIVIALMLLIIMYLLFVLRRVRTQLALIKDALSIVREIKWHCIFVKIYNKLKL